VERLAAFKREHGWRFLPLYSSAANSFNADSREDRVRKAAGRPYHK
jgi:predicted dithiol-disulfide oxidoreductase (DUF899 family)